METEVRSVENLPALGTGSGEAVVGAAARKSRLRWLYRLAAVLLAWVLLGGGYVALAGELQTVKLDSSEYDFSISKTHVPTLFTVGGNNRYRIDVSYLITSTTALPPVVEDQLPAGVTKTSISVDSTKWDCTTSTDTKISCAFIGGLPNAPATLPSILVSVNLTPSVEATLFNTAKLVLPDKTSGNNESQDKVLVESVDLEIKKSVEPLIVLNPGDPITYTFVITNNGPADATNVIVKDPFSQYLDSPVFMDPPGSYDPSTGIWTLGPLAKGMTIKLTLIANTVFNTDPALSSSGRQVINTATVSSLISPGITQHDWKTTNNTDTATFIVGGLEITKEVDIARPTEGVYVGEVFTYTVIVKNASSVTINNIIVTDDFAPELDVLRAYQVQGATKTQIPVSRIFSRNIGTLEEGQQKILIFFVRPNSLVVKTSDGSGTNIENKATVKWRGADNIQQSRASNTVVVQAYPAVDLQVGKTDSRTTVMAGQMITYTLSLTNTGSLSARNVVITDTVLTPNLSLVSVSKDDAPIIGVITATTTSPYVWVWRLVGELDPGEKITWRVAAKVSTGLAVGTQVINSVQVRQLSSLVDSPDYEHVKDNNFHQDIDTITATPSLTIKKQVGSSKSKVGESIQFRIDVTNSGGITAYNVKVTDVFVSVLDFVSNTPNTGTTATTNTSTRTLTWTIGTLVPGQSVVLFTTWKFNSTAETNKTYENKALVTWNPSYGEWSNTVKFRLSSGTLPDTGWPPPQAGLASVQAAEWPLLPTLALTAGGGLGLLGLLVLGYGLFCRSKRPLWAGIFLKSGLFLLLCAALLAFAGWSLGAGQARQAALPVPPTQAPDQALHPSEPTATVTASNQAVAQAPEATATSLPPSTPELTDDPEALWNALVTPTPLSLPEYQIPTPSAIPAVINGLDEPDSSAITRIQIPALGVDTIVKYVPFNGDTWLIGGLRQEVAWMGDTSWPGLGSNTGLAGHVDLADGSDGPFRRLNELHPGDLVILYTEKKIYTYQVREQKVVDEDDLSVISPTEKPQITLITCTNWSQALRDYLQRLVIFAELIAAQPLPGAS